MRPGADGVRAQAWYADALVSLGLRHGSDAAKHSSNKPFLQFLFPFYGNQLWKISQDISTQSRENEVWAPIELDSKFTTSSQKWHFYSPGLA